MHMVVQRSICSRLAASTGAAALFAQMVDKRNGLSPAKRKAQSERMQAYWAKRKKQAKG
jgi:hypothetical protein